MTPKVGSLDAFLQVIMVYSELLTASDFFFKKNNRIKTASISPRTGGKAEFIQYSVHKEKRFSGR